MIIDYDNFIKAEKLYNKGFTVKEIADNLNLFAHNIYQMFKKHGLKLKSNKEILSERRGNKSPLWAGFKSIPRVFFTANKNSAATRSIDFNIKIEDIYNLYIEQNKKCKLSNIDLDFGSRKIKNSKRNASIDRIDSAIGYTINNIQLVDSRVNIMKKDFTLDHFFYLCNLVINPIDADNDQYVYDKNCNVNLTYRTCERRANSKKFDFNLSRDILLSIYEKQNKRCAITNLPIEFKAEYRKPFFNQASIDRIDSSVGYVKENIQLVIKDINFMKHKINLSELKFLCKEIVNNNGVKYARL